MSTIAQKEIAFYNKLPLKSFIDTSFLDFPGRMCSVLFLALCNFRCPYCHNSYIVKNLIDDIPFEILMRKIKSVMGWCEAICVSGGEPTIHDNITELIAFLKRYFKFIKLDTNGYNVEVLERLIHTGLIDFISMDVKTILDDELYSEITDVKVDTKRILSSIRLIKKTGIRHEFRMTVMPKFHNEKIIKIWKNSLRGDSSILKLQNFSPKNTLSPLLSSEKTFSPDEFNKLKNIILD